MFSAGVTVEVWRLPGPDAPRDLHGNQPKTHTLHHTEDGWAIAPADQNDNAEPRQDGRDVTVDRWLGFREDQQTTIVALDEVRVPDATDRYEVVGKPGPWRDPWDGRFMGSEMRLRLVSG